MWLVFQNHLYLIIAGRKSPLNRKTWKARPFFLLLLFSLQSSSRARAVVFKEEGKKEEGGGTFSGFSSGLVLIILTIKLKELKQSKVSRKRERGKEAGKGQGDFRWPVLNCLLHF